ncbi:MAG: PadR family transcriptional regulator [Thermoproteota archaeon]|jgi:DNA-binding PadR family transcriptional regulator|nr:PadR family transcriptional regulator [Thermoproteota archaeon]MDQ4012617.1 PadR family transcriptional regulator [Thermoproteota archaeon]MDQ4066310.1 PadR family transcriptional regulator [Thermoproteota archaeon]
MRRRDHCRFGPFRVGIIPQGLLKPFILKLLSERPMHGFEIMEEIFQRTVGMWHPGPSSIYPALIQLEEEGYIEPVITQQKEGKSTKGGGEKSRRPYRISKKGAEVLRDYERFRKEWLENVSQLRRMWL